MFEKTKLMVNCDLCDTRKLKEEDYSHYEKITINTDLLIVSKDSKSIFNRLPITANYDTEIELSDDAEVSVKIANGPYEITGKTSADEHTIFLVNGPLTIEPDTEEIIKKYDKIVANGPVKYPKSMEGCLNKMTINGPVQTYPDGYVLLGSDFTIDKYFPLRARENGRYYVDNEVVIKDSTVDAAMLAAKNILFASDRVILPESLINDIAKIFDEQTEFVVVPEGMKLIYGDSALNHRLLNKEGGKLFIYGNLDVDKEADIEALLPQVQKLIVKGCVLLRANQEEAFYKLDAEYDEIKIIRDCRRISNVPKAYLDKALFDNSPNGIEVCNAAEVVISDNVSPEMILEKLSVTNCAKINCSKEQESAASTIAVNVAKIGNSSSDDEEGGVLQSLKDLKNTKMINADSFIM